MQRLFLTLTLLLVFILVLSFVALFTAQPIEVVFKELLSPEVVYALKLSLITAAISTVIVLLLALPVAYSLSRWDFPLKSLVRTIIDMPLAFPELVIGFLLLLLFSKFLDPFLSKFNIEIVFSKAGIVVAQIFVALPFAVRILYTSFSQVDKKYELVSRSLGYSAWETFLNITLPMVKIGIVSAALVTFARALGAFGAVLVFAGGTYMKTETLPIGLYLNLSYGNMARAIAFGIILIVVSFISLFVIELFKGKVENNTFRG